MLDDGDITVGTKVWLRAWGDGNRKVRATVLGIHFDHTGALGTTMRLRFDDRIFHDAGEQWRDLYLPAFEEALWSIEI